MQFQFHSPSPAQTTYHQIPIIAPYMQPNQAKHLFISILPIKQGTMDQFNENARDAGMHEK
jgi:hypothetical protein